jgi:hypothetical protein
MGRLFADMEAAENAKFDQTVGALGRLFIEIEAEALGVRTDHWRMVREKCDEERKGSESRSA